MRRALAVATIAAFVLASRANAHQVSVEEILALLNGASARQELGVVRAALDEKLPRLLIIEVEARWYELPKETRREKASDWAKLWRHTVPQGIVAVLDRGSGEPVVEFRPGGVTVVSGPPRKS